MHISKRINKSRPHELGLRILGFALLYFITYSPMHNIPCPCYIVRAHGIISIEKKMGENRMVNDLPLPCLYSIGYI